jgi:hypothetical protein
MSSSDEDAATKVLTEAFSAMLAGAFSTSVLYPLEVIKTKMQGMSSSSSTKSSRKAAAVSSSAKKDVLETKERKSFSSSRSSPEEEGKGEREQRGECR